MSQEKTVLRTGLGDELDPGLKAGPDTGVGAGPDTGPNTGPAVGPDAGLHAGLETGPNPDGRLPFAEFDSPSDPPSASPSAALPDDYQARLDALDVNQSWIVQAPAGAGKTELLTQRFLKLLTIVEEPEEILAITFTRAATAEMRTRVLTALEDATRSRRGPHPRDPHPRDPHPLDSSRLSSNEQTTLGLAHSAMVRSDARKWQLLEQPHRLDIQTIDSLCLRLAHGQPLLARLGGRLAPTEQAAPLYALAARNTFSQLGRAPQELEQALEHLLLLRDNNLRNCQALIAAMLERRDQWRHLFLRQRSGVDWDQVRGELERPFADEVGRVLDQLHQAFSAEPTLVRELFELAQYACDNGGSADLGLLQGLRTVPPADPAFLEHWGCLRNLLLTKYGDWRQSVDKRHGFPANAAGMSKTERTRRRDRMIELIAGFQRNPSSGQRLRTLLDQLPDLPAARYTDEQWQTLLAIFLVLRHAVAELHVVFAERNQVDFAELSIAAATVLDDEQSTRGLLASESKRHLLIDEFQDTSRRQHELIGRLLKEWRDGDQRTCFLVGDPMQSIYIFRQAEVELFGRVQRQGLDCGAHQHPCSELALTENFRSHQGLVDPLNQAFTTIFERDNPAPGDVPFSPSHAPREALPGESLLVHPFLARSDDKQEGERASHQQVEKVVEIVRGELSNIEQARAEGAKEYKVAILGRAKAHLAPIAAALRQEGIAFRAIELETLTQRQEILDLLSLARALLHPADRIAWLGVLRAPWCGLRLSDLHILTGSDNKAYRDTPIPELIAGRTPLLTVDGQARVSRVAAVLEQASAGRFAERHAQSFASWVERTWTSLGAPAYLKADERENAETFFRLLDELSPDGIAVLDGTLAIALGRLCAAPDSDASEEFGVQLMTMHKAKGLGFQVTIVPGLERGTGADANLLVSILERSRQEPEAGEEHDEVLIAPLGRQGETHRTYRWVQTQRRNREAGERKRLFYVACTRARLRLHLLGTATISKSGKLGVEAATSLLACAWPAFEEKFTAAYADWQAEQARSTSEPAAALASEPGADSGAGPAIRPGAGLGAETAKPFLVSPAAAASTSNPTLLSGLASSLEPAPGVLPKLAAGAQPAALSDPPDTLRLWRVPAGFTPRLPLENTTAPVREPRPITGDQAPNPSPRGNAGTLKRPQGSFEQRARGNAIHAMLELLSRNWAAPDVAASLERQLSSVARSTLRRDGLPSARVDTLTREIVPVALAVAADPMGQWILQPHPEAASEQSWSSLSPLANAAGARLRTLRVDRVFRAGVEPLSAGHTYLWVIDYKTGSDPGGTPIDQYLEAQKEQWRPQLEAYGAALRAYHGPALALRYALYFPELLRLAWWEG
jgi:ATP-dependent exoDNAse (exonuclease V) beta subunit